MRVPRIEVKPHPKDPSLFNLLCYAANGEHLWTSLQGYSRRNVKRAIARIKANTALAEPTFTQNVRK